MSDNPQEIKLIQFPDSPRTPARSPGHTPVDTPQFRPMYGRNSRSSSIQSFNLRAPDEVLDEREKLLKRQILTMQANKAELGYRNTLLGIALPKQITQKQKTLDEKKATLEELFIEPKDLLPEGVESVDDLIDIYETKRNEKKDPQLNIYGEYYHKGLGVFGGLQINA